MPRYFTLQQATDLLPHIDAALRQAIAARAEYREAETALRAFTQRVNMLGGVQLDQGAFAAQRSRMEASGSRLKELIEQIHEHGCLIKDLDAGLVDFPTFFRGEEVYLCWKLDEPAIEFWHKVEDGFRGRQPIDDEFRKEHRGGRSN